MPIEFRCPICGKGFKVDEKHVGRKTICKGCGTTILVPQPGETEAIVIPSEDEVLVPATAAEPPKRVIERDGQLFAAISKHIEQHVGPIARVFRDHVNEKKQVDILWVKPTAKTPFHTLATCGMAEQPMQIPPEADGFPYAEMILCLPQNWPIDESALANEAIYWPLRWMKLVARLPQEQNTYVARSQVLPNGVPARPFHANTTMTAWMFTPPQIGPEELPAMAVSDRTVDFFAMTAIHTDELRFYYQHGYLETLRRLKAEFPSRTLHSMRRPSFLNPHR
ncbi:suppressor of fused domain protein [Blastopirellula sp. JC732]|uniref:Suppressor of fused domain protein n=1 Tax=Blastopirellula sediminis TaxID=2894196 RepID=A0A9X1SGX8_9BACT|nr:suppressor of fused domain protein [Blastopirellula sediminis]MCC9606856.1 suppressor of fused domain protein [Blastopirellula sediminis]MCC9629848.1 suppressor of fused domain protein [Blastopirellula sediminis]